MMKESQKVKVAFILETAPVIRQNIDFSPSLYFKYGWLFLPRHSRKREESELIYRSEFLIKSDKVETVLVKINFEIKWAPYLQKFANSQYLAIFISLATYSMEFGHF